MPSAIAGRIASRSDDVQHFEDWISENVAFDHLRDALSVIFGLSELKKHAARDFRRNLVKIVEKRVAKAIEEYEKTRADSNNTGGSGSANTGGTVAPDVQGCSYKTFMNGKPHSFSGTEGVVGLKRWFEKMEQVFEICKCAEDDKIPWSNVKAMMTTEYCPATEIQRMEQELWTLTLKGDDIEAYNNPSRTGFDPATLYDAINMARELIEQGVQAKALRIGDSTKRKWEDQQGNNHHQQQNRRQEVAKPYPPRCGNCHKLGHQEGECRTRIPVAGGNSLWNVTCFGCGNQGHYRSDCPELKNRN
ncbi:putative reverse transcriptase domain-containing protein [Tanacetum coccineum]|uniref:Reverse transcriptase domain-containing protein n=1 Tax=Tanacetum coccineum TaxID=301880 RepID=A0ABQ4X9D5_9ASTR